MSIQLLKHSRKLNSNILRCFATNLVNKCQFASVSSKKDFVLIDVNDKTGYATLSLNKPPVNSMNIELLHELSSALDEMEKNKSRGVILTSTLPTIFCAGMDIKQFHNPDSKYLRELWNAVLDNSLKLYSSSFPTAAALNGHTIAGGCFFAILCEYRALVKNQKFGINEIQVGIAVPQIIVMIMKNLLSSRQAEMALTQGKLFSSEEALKIGLIDDVANDKEDAIKKCEKFLDRFKKIPPAARSITKQFIHKNEIEFIQKFKAQDVENFVKSVENPEAQNFIQSYLETLTKKR